jgi:hypothetical protein
MIPKEMNKALWENVERIFLEHTKGVDEEEKKAFVVSMIMLIDKAIDIALKIEITKLLKTEQQKEGNDEKRKEEKE